MKGLLKLTWLEIKIFVREPLGVFGTIGVPVLMFVVLGRLFGGRAGAVPADRSGLVRVEVPVFTAILIAVTAVLSLTTIIAIYREGGILKRLRATPLRPATILCAHVIAKLLFTAITMALLAVAGRRAYPVDPSVPFLPFGIAVVLSTLSILSLGFVIASVVPSARLAQPLGSLVLYPMIGISGLFVPVESLPPVLRVIARFVPFTYAVSLMKGIWLGDAWSAHLHDLAALAVVFVVCTAISSRVFRWE